MHIGAGQKSHRHGHVLTLLWMLLSISPCQATELRTFRPFGTNFDITVPLEWIPVDTGDDPARIQLTFQIPAPANTDPAQTASIGVVIFNADTLPDFRKTRSEATLDHAHFPCYVELEHSASNTEEAIRYQTRKNAQTTLIRENFLWNADTGIIVVASAPELATTSLEWKQAYTHGIDILLGSLRRGLRLSQ